MNPMLVINDAKAVKIFIFSLQASLLSFQVKCLYYRFWTSSNHVLEPIRFPLDGKKRCILVVKYTHSI